MGLLMANRNCVQTTFILIVSDNAYVDLVLPAHTLFFVRELGLRLRPLPVVGKRNVKPTEVDRSNLHLFG